MILSVLIILGATYFLIRPYSKEVLKTYKQLNEAKDILSQEELKKEKIEVLRREREGLEGALNQNKILLPEDKKLSDFIKFLEDLAWDSNCSLTTIKIVEPEGNPTISQAVKVGEVYQINLEAEIQGKLSAILSYLKKLKEAPRFNKINFWTLAEKGEGYSLDFNLNIYFRPKT